MATRDGVRAWQILRRLLAYREAWRRRAPQPGLPERAPFPVRLQTVTDLAAARFGLLAWEDPFAAGGPASPFWKVVPMMPAAISAEATPLADADWSRGVALTGLRLLDGRLVLKLDSATAAMQFRVAAGSGCGPLDGLMVQHDLLAEPREFVRRVREGCALATENVPRRVGGRGTGIRT